MREVIDTIGAVTDSAPVVVEYNNFLHIFWRDTPSGAIKFMYITDYGYKSGIFELPGIRTNGSFDGEVFNGKLYLVYSSDGAANNVYLSYCEKSDGACYLPGDWHNFGTAQEPIYRKSLGYEALPGMGIAAGSKQNGTVNMNEEYLYIVSASNGNTIDRYKIRFDQVDKNNERNASADNRIPDHYWSNKTDAEIGLKMVKSAYPDRNYLYTTWKGMDGKIYKAIVRTFDEQGGEDTWVTMSDDTFLRSHYGVRIQKGEGEAVSSINIGYVNTSQYILISTLFGRY